jgi:hypothetical protein
MNDHDRLLDELRDLPRVEAGESFTRQVLLRLDDREQSARLSLAWPRLGWALAATLLLVVTITSAATWEKQRRREELRGELARLRSAQMELLEEFHRTPQPPASGLVYVGSDDGTDYLLDLGEVRALDPADSTASRRRIGSTIPASSVY